MFTSITIKNNVYILEIVRKEYLFNNFRDRTILTKLLFYIFIVFEIYLYVEK